VIPPARIGRVSNNKKAVTRIAQTKRGKERRERPGALILKIVVIKLIAPNKELRPATCKERIVKSIPRPGWPIKELRGG
jgi:hypothetical protein